MRVLHLTPTVPWPADSGGKICVWNHLQADARFAETGILSFSETTPDAITLGALRAVCREVEIVRRPRTLDGVVGGARSLLSNMAMNMAKYRWPEFSKALGAVIVRWNPDVVVAHHLHMGSYLLEVPGAVTILREHNVDSDLMARYAATIRNPALVSFARRQVEQIRDMEAHLAPRVKRCLMITAEDEATLKEISPAAVTAVLPGVIDPDKYAPVEPPTSGEPIIVTAGSFNFRPTGEGLVHFVDNTWPRILKSLPKARLRVIGHCPDKLARRVAGPGIEVLGRVDQVRPHLAGANAFVVPLRVGSGMRIRILEAFAWQVPIVSTMLGCKGIEVQDGRHMLIEDEPAAMAAAVVRLVKEPALASTIRREGRRLLEKSYSLATSELITQRLYAKCLDGATVDQDVS